MMYRVSVGVELRVEDMEIWLISTCSSQIRTIQKDGAARGFFVPIKFLIREGSLVR